LTHGKIYDGVFNLSAGKGDLTKKTLKENEKKMNKILYMELE